MPKLSVRVECNRDGKRHSHQHNSSPVNVKEMSRMVNHGKKFGTHPDKDPESFPPPKTVHENISVNKKKSETCGPKDTPIFSFHKSSSRTPEDNLGKKPETCGLKEKPSLNFLKVISHTPEENLNGLVRMGTNVKEQKSHSGKENSNKINSPVVFSHVKKLEFMSNESENRQERYHQEASPKTPISDSKMKALQLAQSMSEAGNI